MERFKKNAGKPGLKTTLGVVFSVLLMGVMNPFTACNNKPPALQSQGDTALPNKYHIPAYLAKQEVQRYQDFLQKVAGKLGRDSVKIPRYFTVNNADFLEAMGIDSLQREKLDIKFTHSRLYISLDTNNSPHLLFTPVNGAAIGDPCAEKHIVGTDTLRMGSIFYPECTTMKARYGGQQAVDSIFARRGGYREPLFGYILFDLNAPCPATCFTSDNGGSFVRRQ